MPLDLVIGERLVGRTLVLTPVARPANKIWDHQAHSD